MKRIILLTCCVLFSSQLEANARVWSRSIMPSCQFVYQVESDVRVQAPSEVLSNYSFEEVYLKARFKNTWDNDPANSETFYIALNPSGLAEFTFESMSVSKEYLFRNMTFSWVRKQGDDWESMSAPMVADVGRQFGESCYVERYSDSQYVERELRASVIDQ
ncbi:MAG: hypothetical protein R3A80_13940 [Bdellovibrionota bacterium]